DWFGNGAQLNLGIGTRELYVGIDGDTPEALAWMRANLPHTPMKTKSARGEHWYYCRPPNVTIPAFIIVSEALKIEVKRDGQYLVAPGSLHPSGMLYEEIEPWPAYMSAVPLLPDLPGLIGTRAARTEPLPETVRSGGRNATLFREGCRVRRLGWDE